MIIIRRVYRDRFFDCIYLGSVLLLLLLLLLLL